MKNQDLLGTLKNLGFKTIHPEICIALTIVEYINPTAHIILKLSDDTDGDSILEVAKNVEGGIQTTTFSRPTFSIEEILKLVKEYSGLELGDNQFNAEYTWEACMERLDRSYYLDKNGDLKPYPHQSIDSDDLLQMYNHIPKEKQSTQMLAQTRLMVICDVLNREFPNSKNTAVYHPIIYTNGTRILWDDNEDNINPLVHLVSEEALEAFYKHTENIKLLEEYFAFTDQIINP